MIKSTFRLFAGAALAAAMFAAPAFAQSNSPVFNQNISGALDITVTNSLTHTATTQTATDRYRGHAGYANAEHGGFVKTRTDGSAVAGGVTLNAARAGFSGSGVRGAGSIASSTEALSGSLAVAGSAGSGSSYVESAGYAAGAAGGRFENGVARTTTGQTNTTASTRLQGTGSLSVSR